MGSDYNMIREHQPEDVEESDAELRKSVEQMGFLMQLEYNLIAGYEMDSIRNKIRE